MWGPQGKIPNVYIKGKMTGQDASGNYTNNSVIYRGRPYSLENAIDMAAIDAQREKARVSWSEGLRVLGYILTTGTKTPNN